MNPFTGEQLVPYQSGKKYYLDVVGGDLTVSRKLQNDTWDPVPVGELADGERGDLQTANHGGFLKFESSAGDTIEVNFLKN